MDNDPEAFWREAEVAYELWQELERVAPIDRASLPEGVGYGYTFTCGQEHALRVHRGLSDGAGYEAFLAAVESTPVDE